MPLDVPMDVQALHDPLWRLRVKPYNDVLPELYWITNKAGERVLFDPNDAQKDFIREHHGRDIILKARQLGFTTLLCVLYLDYCLFNNNTRAAIIAHKLDDAKIIFRDKVKFVYDNLPADLKQMTPLTKDSADELMLSNNSSLRVSTSARSGTLQLLHVSEFGKICATAPEKAREIVTGAFPAVGTGGRIAIESTAEGQDGHFYRMSQEAQQLVNSDTDLSQDDYKFHFYPWHGNPEYVANPALARFTAEDEKYFDKLFHEQGITLTPEQRAWYVAKERELGGDMRREYPSTPEEAFEQAIEGAYFANQMAVADKHGRIGDFPPVSGAPVNTFWDLGLNDCTTIWFHQRIGQRNRFIGYYENSGESIAHYADYVREWQRERDLVRGETYWPHDGARADLFYDENETRLDIAARNGLSPTVVPRSARKMDAIDAARLILPSCDFDARECDKGLKHLRMYRKAWDDTRGVFKDKPEHDSASHGADGFMTFATGFTPPTVDTRRRSERPTRRM